MNPSPIARRIGISALSLGATPLDEAIDIVERAGFRAFEFVPRLYGGPEAMDAALRQRLRRRLACFDLVTVHSSSAMLPDGRRADIASPVDAYRRASVEHYLALAQLAVDIGARLATFHAGYQVRRQAAPGQRETMRRSLASSHLACARAVADRFGSSGLRMGFEYFDADLAEEIARPSFGVLFDVGHAALRAEGDITLGTLALLRDMQPWVVQYHIHGVNVSAEGRRLDHQAFASNNGINYARVLDVVRGAAPDLVGGVGPLVLEIEAWKGAEVMLNVQHAALARETLIRLWEGGPA